MKVRFWGVRGSYPVPGQTTNRYGGNTSCVQVIPDDGTIIIVDAGTGIRRLGKALMSGPCGEGQGTVHLLVSHTHWDHIQGLPFFAPLYEPGNQLFVYGRQREVHLEDIFRTQTEAPYFTVHLDEVAAAVSYIELIEGACFELGGARVRCARLNHPNIAVGYRVEADGATVAYVTDTAPFDRILFQHEFIATEPQSPPSREEADYLRELRAGVVDLCRDADLVLFDTMFTAEEYASRPHWGHSTAEHAIDIAVDAGARRLALYHYSPTMTDAQVDEHLARLQRDAPDIELLASAEGEEITL